MSKRRLSGSSGNTPGKAAPKKSANCSREDGGRKPARRSLFVSSAHTLTEPTTTRSEEWTKQEIAALVEYVALYWEGAHTDGWPSIKNPIFWENCSKAIVDATGLAKRTGSSCRTRVLKHLKKKFSLSEAEEFYGVNYFKTATPVVPQSPQTVHDFPLSPLFKASPSIDSLRNESPLGEVIPRFLSLFKGQMSSKMQLQLVNHLFKFLVEQNYGLSFLHFLHGDCMDVILNGVLQLQKAGKENLIYQLARVFSENRMDMARMPFGLIDYNIRFFNADTTVRLKMEEHYVLWQETMFSHFGHKWVALNRGPMWQYDEEEEQDSQVVEEVREVQGCDILAEALSSAGINHTVDDIVHVSCGNEGADFFDEGLVFGAEFANLSVDDDLSVDATSVGGEEACPLVCEIPGEILREESVTECVPETAVHEDSRPAEIAVVTSDGDTYPEEVPECESEGVTVSTLWTTLTREEREEIEESQADPLVFERLHGIVPQNHPPKQHSGLYKPEKAYVNIAGLGVRQIQRRIRSYNYSRDSGIQLEVLKKAHSPGKRWWIKADACDLRKGLRESVKGKWAGDEDRGDGALENLLQDYEQRRAFVRSIGVGHRAGGLQEDLHLLLFAIETDTTFLHKGEQEARDVYEKRRRVSNASETVLIALAWDLVGFEDLLKESARLTDKCNELIELASCQDFSLENIQNDLTKLRNDVTGYLKQLFSKKRVAATHLMVFMIADEARNFKPYALPVRVLPYASMTDGRLRELEQELRTAMVNLGMVVVGFVTDGEFNSLRTMGSEQPISILQLISDSRTMARSMRVTQIERCFKLDAHGNPVNPHPAIPVEDVRWLNELMNDRPQMSLRDALGSLKRRLFPLNYEPCEWIEGKEDDKTGCLKSTMAIYFFRKKVADLQQEGIDFSASLVVPEVDATTKEKLHQREDHNHLLKRIVGCIREGKLPCFNVIFLRDALQDPESGLTYEAITGKNKQSVPDCERMISPGVIRFMERNNHLEEAKILKIIHNWHKAVDGRGLDETTRSVYCNNMLQWILDDWMPYLDKEHPNYSLVDVNRPIKRICGLTREIIVGLIANLETRELRRKEYQERDLPPEHPRASSTDDVEGIISLFHEVMGDHFDLKQFYDEFPKVMSEFAKRIDPDLSFFYWTGHQTRYRNFALPSFNVPSTSGIERLDQVRISRRGNPGVFIASRGSMAQPHGRTTRATHHRDPVPLPPVNVT